jgi:YVTN family beta-propeller protein
VLTPRDNRQQLPLYAHNGGALDGFSRAGAVRLTGMLVATVAVAACCIGVSSAGAEAVIRTIPVGGQPWGVSSDGTHVWVANAGTETVSEIEASSGTVIRTIPVGSQPFSVSSDGIHVWVANKLGDTVSEIPTSYITPPPEASIWSPASGGTYLQGAVVTTGFSCTEAEGGPGIESCISNGVSAGGIEGPCSAPSCELEEPSLGTLVETSTLGPHTFTVTAKSIDGQTVTASTSYTVVGAQQTALTSTAPASATVGGSPKPEATPKAISPGAAFSLPSAKQCVSHRKFTIYVRKLPGLTWISAVIKINHKRIKTIGRSHISALVNLVGLPKGTFVLSITAKASNGQSVTGTRTYHTCVPKSKSHYPTPKL